MIDPGEQGWIQIRPGGGPDLIQVEGTEGTVRLDYSDQTDGIFANLKFGIVNKTVHHDSGPPSIYMDTITGNGRVKEVRGTDHDDMIYGSKFDDCITLRQGDEFVAGGRGNDTVRYDRSGVDKVVVDLGKGTATGIWNGEAFTDTLKSIENVRGSRNDNDKLLGSSKNNHTDGKGGNDIITGRSGDDNLVGGAGNDKFVFRNNDGNDFIQDFELSINNEKTNLKAASAITGFYDLMNNHMSETATFFGSGVNHFVMSATIDDGAGLNILQNGVLSSDLDRGDFVF